MQYLVGSLTRPALVSLMIIGILMAVLQEVREAKVDQIVVGGDVVRVPCRGKRSGVCWTLTCPCNSSMAMLAATGENEVTCWATTSGNPLPEQYRPVFARQGADGHRTQLA
jgi:hypothetical protein